MAKQQLTVQALLWLCTLHLVLSVEKEEPKLKQTDANPCVAYNSTVKELSSDIWFVHSNFTNCRTAQDKSKILRVSTNSTNASRDNPVVFVTRMGSQVQTWHLPLKMQSSSISQSEHTICSRPSNNTDNETDVIMYMDAFTSSVSGVNYSFTIDVVDDFILEKNQNVTLQLAPNKPQLYYYKFSEDVSSVRVVASSSTFNNCAIVSVQNASCPVNDQLQNAMSKGVYQTMISSASLVVTADDTVTGRDFFIVLVSADKDTCNKRKESNSDDSNEGSNVEHQIELVITELRPASSYRGAIALPFCVFLFVGILVLLTFLFPCFTCSFVPFAFKRCFEVKLKCCRQSPRIDYEHIFEATHEDTDYDESSHISNTKHTYGSVQRAIMETEGDDIRSQSNDAETQHGSPQSSLEQTGTFRSMLVQKEKGLMLTSLIRLGYTDLEKSYKVYGWNTITVGIFYALPAFQLVFSEQLILNANGDQDICYYNFKCAHPYSSLSAFNNVLSNIGYFIMGLAFLGIVAIRNYRANKERRVDKKRFDSYGVPQFFGVYYAMGFGMIMEAFMSGFYHICPSDNNFQFDTAFMFIIGGLLIVKMLQVRHPDIQANAFVAFFCFAVVIFLTFIGIWEWSRSYWQTKFSLVILAMIFVVVFSISYYFFHDWRVGHLIELRTYKRIFHWFRSWCVLCNTKDKARHFLPKHPYRFFKMTLLVIANIGSCILLVFTGKGVATVVLALFIINFLILLLLYIICKLWYHETITLMPIVFLVMLGIWWLAAFYFYFSIVSQWEGSPAESRQHNKECIVLDFYDNHDVWHFLSAGAMFFSFLFLLTLDDGIQQMERDKIHVF